MIEIMVVSVAILSLIFVVLDYYIDEKYKGRRVSH